MSVASSPSSMRQATGPGPGAIGVAVSIARGRSDRARRRVNLLRGFIARALHGVRKKPRPVYCAVTLSTPSKMRTRRSRTAGGSGGRRIDATLASRCSMLPVPDSTTSMPASSRQKR